MAGRFRVINSKEVFPGKLVRIKIFVKGVRHFDCFVPFEVCRETEKLFEGAIS